jgi:hypothetical protein
MVGKDKGKQGNVTAYIRELNAVFVSGLNLVKTYFYTSDFPMVLFLSLLGNSTNRRWCHRFY